MVLAESSKITTVSDILEAMLRGTAPGIFAPENEDPPHERNCHYVPSSQEAYVACYLPRECKEHGFEIAEMHEDPVRDQFLADLGIQYFKEKQGLSSRGGGYVSGPEGDVGSSLVPAGKR